MIAKVKVVPCPLTYDITKRLRLHAIVTYAAILTVLGEYCTVLTEWLE